MTDWKIPTINCPYKLGTQNYFTYPLGGYYNPTYRVYVTPLITGFEAHRVDNKRARHGDVFIGHLRHLWLLQQVGGDGFRMMVSLREDVWGVDFGKATKIYIIQWYRL